MTEPLPPTTGARGVTAAMTATNYRGQPLKTAKYLTEGEPLADAVAAYRAAKSEASAEGVLQSGEPSPDCNKRKSYKLPPLDRPSEIEGYPLNPSPPKDIPEYDSMARVKAIKARQRGRKMDPIGPPELIKRGDVRTWKVRSERLRLHQYQPGRVRPAVLRAGRGGQISGWEAEKIGSRGEPNSSPIRDPAPTRDTYGKRGEA
jgi:hypothetical protein